MAIVYTAQNTVMGAAACHPAQTTTDTRASDRHRLCSTMSPDSFSKRCFIIINIMGRTFSTSLCRLENTLSGICS